MEQKNVDPLVTAKILWGALTMSPVMFGVVLFITGKVTDMTLPESCTPLEIVALFANLILLVTYFIHDKKIRPLTDLQKRLPLYIVCWALHESIALIAFVAVFTGTPGHFMIFALNLAVSIVGNLITMPKAP